MPVCSCSQLLWDSSGGGMVREFVLFYPYITLRWIEFLSGHYWPRYSILKSIETAFTTVRLRFTGKSWSLDYNHIALSLTRRLGFRWFSKPSDFLLIWVVLTKALGPVSPKPHGGQTLKFDLYWRRHWSPFSQAMKVRQLRFPESATVRITLQSLQLPRDSPQDSTNGDVFRLVQTKLVDFMMIASNKKRKKKKQPDGIML